MNNYSKAITTIPSFIFYNKLNTLLQKYQNKKIALNTTSLFHASFTIIMGIFCLLHDKNYYLLQMNTGGYFIFDFFYMIKEAKYNLLNMMYFYHHITAFFYILLDPYRHYWPYVLFYGEMSNIPNYLVYYSLKNDKKRSDKKKSSTTKKLMMVQLCVYTVLRIFFLGYYGTLELKKEQKPIIIYLLSILYLFGCIWLFAMIKQNIKNIK